MVTCLLADISMPYDAQMQAGDYPIPSLRLRSVGVRTVCLHYPRASSSETLNYDVISQLINLQRCVVGLSFQNFNSGKKHLALFQNLQSCLFRELFQKAGSNVMLPSKTSHFGQSQTELNHSD